ncbi:MAG TPA: hypothetical protein VFG15_20650 [Amycolatopsis sp.]|nr:hypothetical protein [Amycolatopsis sp.]
MATGASLFPGSVAGAGAELRINSVLHVKSRLEPGAVLPIGWIAAGDPATLFSPDRHDELWELQRTLDFPARRTAFREGPRCARSCPGRPGSTARTKTIGRSKTDAASQRGRRQLHEELRGTRAEHGDDGLDHDPVVRPGFPSAPHRGHTGLAVEQLGLPRGEHDRVEVDPERPSGIFFAAK